MKWRNLKESNREEAAAKLNGVNESRHRKLINGGAGGSENIAKKKKYQ
jgi:hypothetical protein